MSNFSALDRNSSSARNRLAAVEWSVPSSEPDTSDVDGSWFDQSPPRQSFIAYKPGARRSAAPAPAQELAYDVWESQHALLVLVDLPGVEAEHVSLKLGGQALFLRLSVPDSGEPRLGVAAGDYEVRVELPLGAGPDAIDAALRHGVLRVRVSKENSGARRVTITPGDSAE